MVSSSWAIASVFDCLLAGEDGFDDFASTKAGELTEKHLRDAVEVEAVALVS